MTSDHPSDAPPSGARGRWRLFIPSALLLLGAAVWSGFWFYAAARADQAVDAWLAREAARGRIYACADKRVVGFPFRVELVCDSPTARLPGDGGDVVASATRFAAVAQVYDPRRLIGELTGPVEATAADGARTTLTFALAQASALAGLDRFERGSIDLTAPRLVVDGVEVGAAKRLQAHLRRRTDGAEGAYDLAARLDDGVSPALDLLPAGQGPVAIELQAEAHGLDDLRPRPTSERLRAFAEAGGEVHVALARVARGDLAAEAKGDLRLDLDGRLDGALTVTARGLDGVIRQYLGDGGDDMLSQLLGAGAKLLGKKATLDGLPATRYPLKLDRGRAKLGPIALGRVPPAF